MTQQYKCHTCGASYTDSDARPSKCVGHVCPLDCAFNVDASGRLKSSPTLGDEMTELATGMNALYEAEGREAMCRFAGVNEANDATIEQIAKAFRVPPKLLR